MPASFTDQHREIQELVRELGLLRSHNLQFKTGDQQDRLLLVAESLVVLLAMERFLRIILGRDGGEKDTLPNLLQKATSKKKALITLPFADQQDAIKRITDVRNTIMHGNFEQAAKQSNEGSVAGYFGGNFASETERLTEILVHMMRQIDPATGYVDGR